MSVCVHLLSAFTAKSFPSAAPRPSAPWLCHARKTGPLQWAPPRGVPLSVLGQFWRGNRIPFGYTLPFRKHPSPHLFPRVPMHTVEKLWTVNGCAAGTGRWGSVKGRFREPGGTCTYLFGHQRDGRGKSTDTQCPCQAHLTVRVSDERFKYKVQTKRTKRHLRR